MKSVTLYLCILLISLSAAADSKNNQPTAQQNKPDNTSPKIHTGKILRVYTAKDKDATFIAYAVKWKKSEIIVTDMFNNEAQQVGDEITFISQSLNMGKMAFGSKRKILQFSVLPKVNLNEIRTKKEMK